LISAALAQGVDGSVAAHRVDFLISGVLGYDRLRILASCHEHRQEVGLARTDLILGLANAPQSIAGHSRMVDVERALDCVEDALN
jgi:hypothetical protein